MDTTQQFIGSTPWWSSPSGSYVLAWERQWFDASVSDVFGFHALQLGLPVVQALQTNRMPHRWLACGAPQWVDPESLGGGCLAPKVPADPAATFVTHLHCEFDALPFASQSLDLVVMPHTLELARDPHLTLREVERVLVPEGRLMISAFNPSSWWALQAPSGRGASKTTHLRAPPRSKRCPARPPEGAQEDLGRPGVFLRELPAWPARADMIGFRRLRDWLRLLSFEVEAAQFGCFGPRVDTLVWQQRWSWIEPIGQRWWPVLGAVYGLTAVKRVRGMRLVGLAKRRARYASAPRPSLVRTQQSSRRSGSGES